MERIRSTPEVAMKPRERAVKPSVNPREVAIVAYPGVQSLDITGPLEVFAGARTLIEAEARAERPYRVRILSRDGAPLDTSSGLTLVPDATLSEAPAEIDTLVVPGGAPSRLRMRTR
jgi:transcriptional regulator GlxA family with amidase domain